MKFGKTSFAGSVILASLLLAGTKEPPATQPAGGADPPVPTPALPDEFSVLQTRNVFGTPKNHGGSQGAGGPEAGFVLKGVVQAGSGFTAFVEELASKQVKQVATGESLARGKIKSIDLETIEYEQGGSDHKIEVGQDLNGQTPPPPPPPAPAAPPGNAEGGPPEGQPGPGQAGPGQPGGPQKGGRNRHAGPPPPQNPDGEPS